jgi:hypothetical protein
MPLTSSRKFRSRGRRDLPSPYDGLRARGANLRQRRLPLDAARPGQIAEGTAIEPPPDWQVTCRVQRVRLSG